MKMLSTILLALMLALASCQHTEQQTKESKESTQTDSILAKTKVKQPSIKSAYSKKYSLRKYQNVSRFYSKIAKEATIICMKNNVPPAAILAIAGLESGWNQGYIGKITGNILSLGTRKGDFELPALLLPRLKLNGQILYDSLEIITHTDEELIWENRPPSLKKDYRPQPFAGSIYNLAYFKSYPDKEAEAHLQNITDFVTLFISRDSKIPIYKNTRKLMDEMVAKNGKEILLDSTTAMLFINEISGKPYSFNFRKTWPLKVNNIIRKTGLADLTQNLYKTEKDFENLW